MATPAAPDEGVVAGVGAARSDVVAVALERDGLVVTGSDAVSFVHGQVSADVSSLAVGDSAWSLLLEPQGKVAAWLRITRTADAELFVDVDAGWGESTLARLRRFLLRVDVVVEPVRRRGLALVGPRAADVADGASGVELSLAVDRRGLAGVDLFGPVDGPAPEPPDGVQRVGPEVLEVLRIEQGWPVMGRELDASTIPAEAGAWLIDTSVSFTKGCYTGQELVARVHHRGDNVPRHLRGLVIDGAVLPSPGAPVIAEGVERGAVTSAVVSPTLGGVPVALAMVHRRVELGADVEVDGATARVVDLPFVAPPPPNL